MRHVRRNDQHHDRGRNGDDRRGEHMITSSHHHISSFCGYKMSTAIGSRQSSRLHISENWWRQPGGLSLSWEDFPRGRREVPREL